MCLAISCFRAFLPAGAEPVARRAAELDDRRRILLGVLQHHPDEIGAERTQILGDGGDEILARLAADIGPVVQDDEDAGLGGLLDGREQRRPGIGEDHDHIDLLSDVSAHVGDRLGGVAAGRGVDDLLDARISQRLGDEFHLGDLTPDVFAEAVGIGDREIAMPGLADVVLPALERELALFGRQIHRRMPDRFGDDRRDVLGRAHGLQHQFLGVACLRRRRPRKHGRRHDRHGPVAHSLMVAFHCIPPLNAQLRSDFRWFICS